MRGLRSFLLFFLPFSIFAQQPVNSLTSKNFLINRITIVGNFRTKTSIVRRELTFKEGDTINNSDWGVLALRSNQNISNTSLFNFVTLDTIIDKSRHCEVFITLVERWYIYPIPVFQVEERNFNTWWVQDKRSLERVDYGFTLADNNSRGRKEIVKIKLQLGYTQQVGFTYDIPYITKQQDLGMQFNFSYSENRDIPYTSINNILTYLNTPESVLRRQYNATYDLTYRKGLYDIHYFEINFEACYINDTLLKTTTNYLPYNLNHTAFFGAKYFFRRDLRDCSPFPLTGYYFDFSINDYGLDMLPNPFNVLYLQSSFHKYWKLSGSFYYCAEAEGKLSANGVQPYLIQRGLGYNNDLVRGYEYYVIDGNNYGLIKNELKFRLLNMPLVEIPYLEVKQFSKAYLAIYLCAFSEWGYVGDADPDVQNNFLANTSLWGNGVGLDIVAYYDVVVRFEYSFNKLGQSGFFIHFLASM